MIREFEKFEKLYYEQKRPKHKPTEFYFYLARHIAQCIMRSDTLNWHNYGGYMKMTALSLNVNFTDKYKSKRTIVHNSLSQNCSTDESKWKRSIVN